MTRPDGNAHRPDGHYPRDARRAGEEHGHTDLHECSRCGRLVCEQEVDDDLSEAFDSICKDCAFELAAECDDAREEQEDKQ